MSSDSVQTIGKMVRLGGNRCCHHLGYIDRPLVSSNTVVSAPYPTKQLHTSQKSCFQEQAKKHTVNVSRPGRPSVVMIGTPLINDHDHWGGMSFHKT